MATGTERYWMQPVDFLGLHRILCMVAEAPSGLTPPEFDSQVRSRGLAITQRGTSPARSTIYHHRNTLLRLGLLRKDGGRYSVDMQRAGVGSLLAESASGTVLTDSAREAFGALVLANTDCRSFFFDLFMPGYSQYGLT